MKSKNCGKRSKKMICDKGNKIIQIRPLKAIRAKCLECSAGHATVVKNCVVENCFLFPYRFGTNPRRRGVGGGLYNLPKGEFTMSKLQKSPETAPRSHELIQVAYRYPCEVLSLKSLSEWEDFTKKGHCRGQCHTVFRFLQSAYDLNLISGAE